MQHIVFLSSGAASYVAARRVAKRYGTNNLWLLFADTSIEDEDNYRFLADCVKILGGNFVHLKDGRTPWDIFFQEKFISSRSSNCSRRLKILPCKRWIAECEFPPQETTLHFGIGWEEIHRMEAIRKNWQPYKVDAPLCWEVGEFGWADRYHIMQTLKADNLIRPRLYDMGFAHANCGGFCIKAGKKHFRRLLEQLPERFDYHARQEAEFRKLPNRQNAGILWQRSQEEVLTLEDFRAFHEDVSSEAEGGCGCFIQGELF